MSEATVDAPPATGFKGLQGAHMLPATDGGGVVFPFGWFGPAYYLPEWEFIRYASHIDQLTARWTSLSWWRRQLRGPSRLKFFTIMGLSGLASWSAIKGGVLTEESVPAIAVLCFACEFYYRMVQVYGVQRPKLLSVFPTAVSLSVHAYWWPHSLAVLTVITRSECFQIVRRWLFHLGAAAYIFWAHSGGMLHPLLGAAVIPAIAMQLVQPLVMLASLGLMRIWLGRMPTSADLAPVDPPAGRLGA